MSGDTPTVTNNVVTLGKVTIGSAAGGVQYQKAANSKEHIAGENYPMYGKVQNLAKSKNPAANMKHLSALVAVKVVNEGYGGDITIEDVAFEAKEDIVGDFTLKMPASGGHTFTGQGTAEAKKAKKEAEKKAKKEADKKAKAAAKDKTASEKNMRPLVEDEKG